MSTQFVQALTIQDILATNVKRRRKELRLTQETFATLCGLHRTYIGAIERGERNITMSTLSVIAEAINIPPYQLLIPPPRNQ